jgi:hypothetical protein
MTFAHMYRSGPYACRRRWRKHGSSQRQRHAAGDDEVAGFVGADVDNDAALGALIAYRQETSKRLR